MGWNGSLFANGADVHPNTVTAGLNEGLTARKHRMSQTVHGSAGGRALDHDVTLTAQVSVPP